MNVATQKSFASNIMKRHVVLCTLLLGALNAFSQESKHFNDCDALIANKVFTKSQTPASFKGGPTAINAYIDSALRKLNYQFKDSIIIRLYIDSTGKQCCSTIINYTNGQLDFEKIRAIINGMPKWNPGFQMGKTVCYDLRFTYPISFPKNDKL